MSGIQCPDCGKATVRFEQGSRTVSYDGASIEATGLSGWKCSERGEVPPMPAVINLVRLLDRHPDLLGELSAAEPVRPARRKAGGRTVTPA